MMNIYAKLAKARVELQSKDIKKSGKNTHLKFSYMELEDFLPIINKINLEIGLLPVFTTVGEVASLTIYNTEKENESIVFTSPTAHAKLQGGASAIQELGSQHTYMRRYLYLEAYEIVEGDSLDPSVGQEHKLSEAQIKRLYAIANSKGYNANAVKKACKVKFNVDPENMNKDQYDEMCEGYEALEKRKDE